MRQQQASPQQGPAPTYGYVPLPPPYRRKRKTPLVYGIFRGIVVAALAVVALFSLLAGIVMWFVATRAWDRREAWRWIGVLAVLGIGGYVAFWYWAGSPLAFLWQNITGDLARHLWQAAIVPTISFWAVNAPFAPIVAYFLALLFRRQSQIAPASSLKEISLQEYEQAARAEQATISQALALFEHMTTSQPMSSLRAGSRLEVLGSYEGGELLEFIHAGQFCIPVDMLRVHGIVTGEPSFGKTTTLMRLIAIACQFGRKVVFIDLKGSKKTAALFLAIMAMLNIQRVRMYPQEAMDGWRGDAQALFNRLMEQVDPRMHPFYRAGVAATVVSLAVKAPIGPPRSSHAFLRRLDVRWLKRAYATDTQAQREIRAISEHLNGVALIFSGFFRGIAGALDGSWSFEDVDACYIGIDGTAHKEEAATLGRYLLEDAAHYAVTRKDPADQVTLIIDEFGVLQSTNATDLYERVREAGMSIYAAAQSYESLGQEKNNLLASAAVKILHRTGAPEAFIRFAGERETPQYSRYVGGAGGSEAELLPATNRPDTGNRPDTIMSIRKEYSVTIEEVQHLGLGKIAYIYGGEGAFIQVLPLALPETLVQAAQSFLAAKPQFSPSLPPNKRDRNKEPTNESERSGEESRQPGASKPESVTEQGDQYQEAETAVDEYFITEK